MKTILTTLLCVTFLTGCSGGDRADKSGFTAFVSIAPQTDFVKKIGGEHVDVELMVPPAQSPATYEPSPRQMTALDNADVYFRIGVPFENRIISKVADLIGPSRIVDTRTGVPLRAIEAHLHDEPHDHQNEQADPHIWLDPLYVKIQAETIARELSERLPEHAQTFTQNLQHFQAQLDSVHTLIQDMLKPHAGKTMFVFHPSYGYFADRYQLRQVAVEADGKEPSAQQLSRLVDEIRAQNVNTIFVQKQFSEKTARSIANQSGARIVTIDPLAPDYLSGIVTLATAVAESFQTEDAS